MSYFPLAGFFATHETADDVVDYAAEIGKANQDPAGTMTCTMMMYNTVAKAANEKIDSMQKNIDDLISKLVLAAAYCVLDRIEDYKRDGLGTYEAETLVQSEVNSVGLDDNFIPFCLAMVKHIQDEGDMDSSSALEFLTKLEV